MTASLRRPIEFDDPDLYGSYKSVVPVLQTIERSGVVATSSEGSYGYMCAATDHYAVALVRKLTGSEDPLLVTVASVRAAARLVKVSPDHQGFLSVMWPGAFTAVAESSFYARKIVDNVNPWDRTLAVRVTTAILEARLSLECDVPMVSAAVRYDDGTPVRVGDDARRIISNAMTRQSIPESKVAFVKNDRFRYRTQSTVGRMTGDPDMVDTLRPGVYTAEDIREIVRDLLTGKLAPNTIAPPRSTDKMRSWRDDPTTLDDVT